MRTPKRLSFPARLLVFHVEPEIRVIEPGMYEHVFGAGWASCSWLSHGQLVDQRDTRLGRPEDFWKFLYSHLAHDRSTWVMAHSLGYQLTMLGAWDRIGTPEQEWCWGVVEDPPTILVTRRGRRLIRYVDTANYWRMSLCNLIQKSGLAASAERYTATSQTSAFAAARSKSTLLSELITAIIRSLSQEQICGWQSTAASLSYGAWRQSFARVPPSPHHNRAATNLERAALFGGRLECSRHGPVSGGVNAVDVNSLYPYVMATQPMPYRLQSYQEETTVRELHQALHGHLCLAEVAVEVPPHPLPYRRDGQVDYSMARGVYTLAGEELDVCVSTGMVTAVGRMARYDADDLFSAFVYYFYPRKTQAKEEGRLAEYELYKLILNGLSGKFAQKTWHWEACTEIPAPDRWAWWQHVPRGATRPISCRCLAGNVESLRGEGSARRSFPSITASITAGGRCHLEELVETAGEAQTYYLDTDSLHVSGAGLKELVRADAIHDTRLGACKVVTRGADAHYWGAKQYRVGDMWVSNVLNLADHQEDAGHWMQQTRRGLRMTFAAKYPYRAVVKDQAIESPQAVALLDPDRGQGYQKDA